MIGTRIFRAPTATYYQGDVESSLDVYDDAMLEGMSAQGFNGLWLRAILREVSRQPVFPGLGEGSEERQATLRTLSQRAKRHGVQVYLYFNEPLAFSDDDPFWREHPNVKGAPGSSLMDGWTRTYAMCASAPETLAFLREGSCDLFSSCPELGGVFMITRSEHHTHCHSHQDITDCPRCAARCPADSLVDVMNAVATGVHTATPDAKVIAWNWSWPEGSHEEIIERLNEQVIIMADFERGGRKTIAGRERHIDEYSLSYVGPSDTFQTIHEAAKRSNHCMFAKLQIGTTHELPTVNNLPLVGNILRKARYLKTHDVSGVLACWNFGCRLSINTQAFNFFLNDDHGKDALDLFARHVFGIDDVDDILHAWRLFEEAFDHYPFCLSFLYLGPISYALRYPLPRPDDEDRPMRRSWLPLSFPLGTRLRDAVDGWQGEDMSCEPEEGRFTLDEIRGCLTQCHDLFAQGSSLFQRAVGSLDSPDVTREIRNVLIIEHSLRSVRNIFDAHHLRTSTPFVESTWRRIAEDELAHLRVVPEILDNETELGFHSEAGAWFFDAASVSEKIEHLKDTLG